jgi:hypothetical protein
MSPFTTVQRKKRCLAFAFHLLVITSSNYLVQLPISIFGFHTTWGAFSFPFIFLATDLTVRIFGAPLARRIIFAVMVPALVISYGISALFYMGEWQGFAALTTLTCLSPVSPPPALWPTRWGRSSTSTSLTACVRTAAGGWRPPPPRCSVTSAIRWPSSLSPSGAARTRLWPRTGGNRPRRLLLQGADQHVFFLPMYGVLLNMLLKRLADKSDLSALQPG